MAHCPASIDFACAPKILSAGAEPLGRECVYLPEAGGRRLAAPVVARVYTPRWDCAAMDGHAVQRSDLIVGLRRFRPVGTRSTGRAVFLAINQEKPKSANLKAGW